MCPTGASGAAAQLQAAGMSAGAAASKAAMLERVQRAFTAWRPAAAGRKRAWFVPGRVEIFGKHTDYAGGRSLLCAIERGFCVLAAPRADGTIGLLDVDWSARAEFPMGGCAPAPMPWTAYPATVAARLEKDYPGACGGADVAFASDLPRAAGMSSSSALVVASFLGFDHAGAAARALGTRADLAAYLAAVETGVGTHGGSEDHTAILCCRAGRWSQFRFMPLVEEAAVPAPPGLALVIGVSGAAAAKTGGARAPYNRAARLLAAARSGQASAEFSQAEMAARREQFELESEVLIPAAVAAVRRQDWSALGACAARSQAAADRGLGNQVPETRALVALAIEQGAVAASAFGAGFGGAVWALAPAAERQAFRRRWQAAYRAQFAERAPASVFFGSAAGPAALEIGLSEDAHALSAPAAEPS